jgi:hypothetical protein
VVTPPGFLPGFRPAVLLEKRASEALWSHHPKSCHGVEYGETDQEVGEVVVHPLVPVEEVVARLVHQDNEGVLREPRD